MSFTVYARDAPGRAVGNFGDVTYTWQKKGDPDGKGQNTLNMPTSRAEKSKLCREIFIIVILKMRYQSRAL